MVDVLMMTDVPPQRVGAPSLLRGLSSADIKAVVNAGQLLVLNKGARLFSQGALHDGIFLIRSGRIRVFYAAPSGREITLGYWFPGNFVGAPEIFKRGLHDWSGTAATNSSVLQLRGDVLREMVEKMPALSIGIIEGLTFKGKCYSALAQMLGTRSATERLVPPVAPFDDPLWRRGERWDRDCRATDLGRHRPHDRRHTSMGDSAAQPAGGTQDPTYARV